MKNVWLQVTVKKKQQLLQVEILLIVINNVDKTRVN